ncbi:ankyrin-2 isoform X9 [Musca domestica]|uniref:Ankyrin-2 isoform X9 n=1 Tax=Musca domestica TaxID=7370 RepID=A0ABM3VPX8_MUSDO|nr:ankyrin-2 isoform X9 [Musca domestica]
MAQFVTHIQPTLMEASQGHVPHHHAHQVGVQHSSHLPHSGHNMPSPPTAHNHHQIHHQQQQHHSNHHGHQGSVSSPPGGHHHHHQQQHQHHPHQQQQHHQQQHHHSNHGPGKQAGAGGKHEHCPSGHQSSGDGNTSFLRAARAGNMDKVLEHLKNNIDINTSNANGLNALHLASKDGHVHVVSELLRRGAIVDSATKKGNTALHIASLAGQEEVVKLLLQHGASVNVQSQNGFTPLYMAAQENHDSVVKLLLSNGANQSLATEDGFTPLAVAMQQGHDKVVAVLLESDTRGKVRLPALHIAAKKDDVKAATLLLDNDHNPDVTSKSGFTPLHIASHYGNQAIANLLIQKGADVNFSAKHNISPLHVAAKWGKTNMVSLLLEKGANIEAKTRDGLTPLHCAARSGHEQVVDMLLERGAPISAKTKNGLAPLHMAAQGEHVDAARILLYHRAPVDEVTVDYLTALHVAAHCGHVRVAKLLLDRNADANARALNGFTPLHIACKKNRIKVVELLLRHGASISATTESGLTPLHVAAFMGCMNIVIYLLQHDASPDVPTVRGETPLHLAARANQTDIIRILLRNGAQVDARAREQQTPLHIASRLGNVDIVMLLLQHGAQVDATTKDMYTALHIAAKEGQDEVAAVLIENGAALDAATKKGFTPLHLTAKYGHIKVAQLLLQKEADVDAQGKNGVTPLHVACHYDNQNVALLLLEKGASPHATAKNGHTPLHIAARKNQMDIATTLLEYGAQANAESKAGFTPLHLSCQEGHTEISNLLIEHKAGVNHPAKNGLTPMHLCAQEDNVNVAEILQRNGANIDMATKAGYTPLHVAAHFGQANMVRFLLQHGANVNSATSIGYTPLHQSAQQGHCHIVKLLLEHNADANAQTSNGQTPLDIARKLGYISVLDSLKSYTNDPEGSAQVHSDEKYRVVAPEAMHESFMSDSEEEGGEDNMLSDQPYRYLTVDEMKSLGDDSLPIDVTRDERVDSNRMAQSAEYTNAGLQQQQQQPQPAVESAISPQKAQTYNAVHTKTMRDGGIYISNDMLNGDDHQHEGRKLQWKSFLVSFLVDARGGAMRGCRHSGVRMIIPSRSTAQPTRVTCRYVKPQRTMHPPQLMEGEALASRVLELGPVSTKFIGPVIMEVPHFASLRGKEREIIILRSDNGETWREHTIENSEEIIHDVLQQCFEPEEIAQLEEQAGNHVCRFVTYDFPQYFAVVTRIRQEVHAIGPEGGMVSSTVVPQVQAVFPQGALTKKIKVGLQAQPVDPDLTAKLLGRGVAVSPIVTVEPRRRKFHKAITLSMPAPKAHSQGMINQYSGNTPTLRLLCSITGVFRKRSLKGGPSRAQWEDVTGSTPLTFVNDCVSFTTTVSARFWLMDCRNISEATKMATELYKEVIHVPFIAKFVVFAKKVEPYEARLRVFCMTDDREDKTLEKMELYTQVAKSRDVEVLEGKPQYIEMAGNLVPVTKSGEQLQLPFKAFRENRLPFTVRVKDQHADIVGRTLFMKEPKVAKGEPPQQPICILNIVLPEAVIPDSVTAFSDKVTPTYRSSLLNFSKHQNDHYIGDIRIVDLSNLLGKDWIQLATEIGISTEEIDEIINQNTDSIARQAQSMIRLYKDKPNYDLPALEQALKNIGRDDIMSKCKSGRLSHSRDFDETDIMKNSESVEELVRQESKRIQQIHEREEIKYSAEEKEIEESESDEECVKRSVAERRDKIVKRLSVERQIPASSQKKEISREITEIKRKSLIDDKKAIHESEIMMQLPADNIVKSAVVPEQVIKMKMGKKDSCEVSKSDFDKELTHKFKTSSRSSEEEDDTSSAAKSLSSHEEVDNSKIVKDISSVEKPSKIIDSLKSEQPSLASGTKQLTQDFLAFEKFTQLPSQQTTAVPEKFVGEVKDKSQEVVQTAHEIVSETVETASKKVENIISAFETKKPENGLAEPLATKSTSKIIDETAERIQDSIIADQKSAADAVKSFSETKVDETKEFLLTESESVKDKIKAFTEPKIAEAKDTSSQFAQGVGKAKEFIENESSSAAESVKSGASQVQDKLSAGFDKLGQMFAGAKKTVESEVKETSETIETKANETKSETKEKIEQGIAGTKDFIVTETKTVTETIKTFSEPVKIEEKLTEAKDSVKTEANNVADAIKSFTDKAGAAIDGVQSKIKKEQVVASDKIDQTIADFEAKKVTYEFRGLEPKVTPTTTSLEQEPTSVPEAAPRKTVSTLDDSREKLEEMKSIVADARKLTRDFLSMEQESQLPKPRSDIVEETKQIEKTTVETITFPPVVETTIKEGNDLLMKGSETLHTAKQQIDKHVDEAKQIVDDGIEIAAPITKPEITTSSVKTLTQDFLSFEQAGPMHVTSSSEPRKSLTDAEFCKSVEETITKKMSEGLIEISEQLKLEESDIPHSQTPPPTPIETKNEKSEYAEGTQKATIDEDNLIDTVKTLHKTTESTFERITTISTTETLQEIVPEAQTVTVESVTRQETGGEVSQSTDITPVPPPPAPAAAADATATATVTTEIPMTATITSAATVATETVGEVPKPKPRLAKASSPEKDEAQPIAALEDAIELETSQDSRTSPAPVPKPRSQIKTSDSYKNLTALDDSSSQTKTPQLVQQTDSVSVRSFDLTEETSHMDDTSASQNLENVVTTSATTNTTSDDPATESNELTSDLSIDTSVVGGDRKTSFYIGESSQNIIIKTTPTKLSAVDDDDDQGDPMGIMGNQPIAATDISLMKEISVDSEEDNDVFKEYVTIKTTEPAARIRRQSSETRNDLLEEDVLPKEETEGASSFVAGATSESFEADSKKEKTATVDSTPKTKEDDTVCEMSIDSEEVSIERPTELDLSLEKSEWEMTEKEIPPQGKSKVEHSPQQPTQTVLTKESITEELVAKTLDEVQESLEAAKNELKSVLKDGKSIKESPSEFEFRSFSQTISERFGDVAEQGLKTGKIIEENIEMVETEDISSFIGVPETLQIQREEHQHQIEGLFESSVPETLDRAAAMMHYAQSHIAEGKSDADKEDRASLGFISTGTDDYVEETVAKQEHASLGFVSNETVEEFSSMEDYYQEKLAKADVVESREETTQHAVTSFEEISSERTMKPFDDVVHRVKPDGVDTSQNRWSVPEVEQSSSSESYYKSFEKSESRPLSSDVDNLATQCTSEYKTAAEGSSTYRETTEYMSAASTLDSLSGKTISSHESMRSFDSHSETSANLISMDSSELTETLVASSTDEADEIEHLRDLLDEEDSEESLDLEAAGYALPENAMQQQPMMKRSQEMIFKPKTEDAAAIMSDDPQPKEMQPETAPIPVGQSKPKEVEKTWGLSYPLEESKPEDNRDTEDILLYHGDVRKSVDESKYASSLDEGSILSVSMSSTSNIDTVVENFEDTVGSFGASSLAGIEGFGGSSLPDETTFVMEMEGSTDYSPEECSATTPPDANQSKRGHKRSESEVESAEETQAIPDKETPAGSIGEGKESGSESDTDPYETEYARQFRSPTDRKNNKKKKQAAAEMDHSFETEKRPFTPSQLVAEVIVEDVATEELEAEASMIEDRRPSQNMLDYSNIPDITVTEDTQQKSPILEEEENADKFEEKILYKVKTQEELHKVTDDRPIYQEQPLTDLKEENFQKLVQEQYKQKLAELQKADIGDSDYDENKAPDSPDSFEMVDQPDISDDFVIIEEVAKEANEDDLGGKSIRIKPTKYEPKHDEEVEKIIIKSAPADPMLGSQIFRDDLNFEFEESPPTASSGGTGSEVQEESDSGSDMAATNKRWVEMQLTDNQLRYPYELTGGVLEDIKEEDGEFEVGSSRISSFKDSFSSTPEYDVLAARRYYGRGEHDDVSMSSLQEFESLEQAISLENRNRTHQGSTDSSNGSFQRRYLIRHSASGTAPGDDISISSLKEFEGLENACIEAHLIEIKAKEEAAMLSRSDESNKSNSSDRDQGADSSNVVVSKVTRTVTHTEVLTGQNSPDIEALLKQKLQECEQGQSGIRLTQQQILDLKFKGDSDRGSIESLEMNKSIEMGSSSADDSYDMSKDATRSDIDSLEVDKPQLTREESIESADMQQIDDLMSKFGATIGEGLTTTTTTTTTSTDAEGHEHTTVTRRVVTTTTTLAGSGPSSTSLDQQLAQTLVKDISADSLNQMSTVEQTTTTSSAGTTATYQTSAGNSQMSGSITSCASSILMEDSTNSIATFNITSTATTTQFSTTDPNQPAHPVSGTDDAALKKDEVRR